MKKLITIAMLMLALYAQAQIGIGTTSPNSTLDVRGSFSTKYTSFSANTTAGSSDYTLVFTGTSPATLTLPDATTCQGRGYWVKNTSSNASVLSIATTSSQTVDGIASWSLTQTNKVICVVSNGTNWLAVSESLPGNSAGTAWINGGNNVSSQQNIGTTSNFNLPFITNNTEKMRLTATGNLGIGTSTFNGTNPERLIVDAGTNGSGAFQNVLIGKGNTNSYSQLNIQNVYNGATLGTIASSDVVATSDNGTESVNYIDMGINSSGNNSTGVIGGANTAYLYATGNDFAIGNGTNSKNLKFFTTTGGTYTERMRIDANGNLGIGTTSPLVGFDMLNSSTGAIGNIKLHIARTGAGDIGVSFEQVGLSSYGIVYRDRNTVTGAQGRLAFVENYYPNASGTGNEKMCLDGTGNLGIGTNAPNSMLDVSGSVGHAITTTGSNITLDGNDYTVIINGGTPIITLPAAASTNTRRIYIIVNQTGGSRTISTYKNFSGVSSTTIATASSITIQSDGTNWYRIQ